MDDRVACADFLRLSRMERAVVVDVGANTGEFSRWMTLLANIAARHHSRSHLIGQLNVTMLDPQPSMAPVLTKLVTDLRRRTPNVSVSFLPVAAWTRNGNMTFYSLKSSQESSLMADGADASRMVNSGQKTIVPTIDLAAWLLHGASFSDAFTLRLLKIDIEGAEYDLLPHLIVSGALCRATHLLVEWHLNKLPYSRRLRFLGLRLAFDELLTKGCQSSWAARRQANASFPRVIAHDDYARNNFHAKVPGLEELLFAHNGTWPPDCSEHRVCMKMKGLFDGLDASTK
jgi:FkbM family methyltransferase